MRAGVGCDGPDGPWRRRHASRDSLVLAELREADATGEIAGIYAEIRRLWAVPYVSSLQRHLATLPGWLEWAWAMLGPAFVSGLAQTAAWRAAEGVAVPRLPPVSRDALRVWSVDQAGEAAIRARWSRRSSASRSRSKARPAAMRT